MKVVVSTRYVLKKPGRSDSLHGMDGWVSIRSTTMQSSRWSDVTDQATNTAFGRLELEAGAGIV